MFFASVLLAVTAHAQITVTNTTPITIRDNNTADPYPSSIAVSNYLGTIKQVTVHLDKVTHQYPDDIDVLLVAPNGSTKQFILMGDAGGQFDLNGADLRFDSTASSSLPDETQIVTGDYTPSNYDPADTFAGVTLDSLGSNLNQLVGTSANGDWKLYVVDDQVVDAGAITSWRLTLYMKPVISVTNAVTTKEDESVNVAFTINDTDTPIGNLITSSSFDTNFIQTVELLGAGNSRTARIVPKANANTGSTTVTLYVRDSAAFIPANYTATNITVTITPVNDTPSAPALSSTSTTIQNGGISTNINVTLADIDSDANTLQLFATSSSNNIVSPTNVYFGGTGTARTVQVASTGISTGMVTLTIHVVDPTEPAKLLTNTTTLTVNVVGSGKIVDANTAAITVADGGEAVSTNNVSGISGLVKDVEVVLLDLEAQVPSDLAVLLVGPNGGKVILVRASGGSNGITNRWVKLDDDSGNVFSFAPIITNGTYRPTNGANPADIGGSAPAGPYDAQLSAFDNLSANGNWVLYVRDENANSQGAVINGGWQLQFNVGATIAGIAATNATDEDKPIVVGVTIGDQDGNPADVTVASISSDTNLFTAAVTGSGASRTLTITPTANAFGNGILTNILTDSSGFTTTNTTIVQITGKNDEPTLSFIPKLTTRIGQPVSTNITVGDVDNDLNTLLLSYTSNNPKLLPAGSVVFTGTGANRAVNIFPAGTQEGSATITVRVTDTNGAFAERSFDFNALAAGNPLFENNNLIAVPDPTTAGTSSNAIASPITVSGLNGVISEIEVTLFNITHPAPQHLDVMLVGPTSLGTNVILLSDVGGNSAITNQTLVFRTSGTNVPASLTSGIYFPTNGAANGDAGEDLGAEFSGVAGTVASSLTVYSNAVPNGTWQLLVRDDTMGPRGGVIEGGWLISIRTQPSIQAIGTVTLLEDQSTNFPVTFSDNQPGVTYTFTNTITPVSGTPSNVVQVTTEQKGGTVIVGITPYPDAFGTNDVTLTVTDGSTTNSRTFQVRIQAVADNPRLSNFPTAVETTAATLTSVTFGVFDPETADLSTIPVSVTSDKTSLIPNEYISVSTSSVTNRTISFVSRGTLTGTATLTVVVGNDASGRTTNSFLVTVTENRQALSNTGTITLPAQGDATPFPSTITVNQGDVQGTITAVSVILDGFTHTFPDDVDVMLVAPNGATNVLLMSDSGGGNSVQNLRLAFGSAGSAMPDTTILTNGTYLPTNNNDVNEVNETIAGLSSAAFNTDITKLYSLNPVGTWSLYVRDDAFPDGGTINNGWILLFQTAPLISQISTQTFNEDTEHNVPFTVVDGDTPKSRLGVTATVDTGASGINANLLVNSNLTVTVTDAGYNLRIRPQLNEFGESSVKISVVDSNTPAAPPVTSIFRVKVNPVNDAPTITATNTVFQTLEQTAIVITYTISDVDSTLRSTNLTVSSGNTGLLTNIVIQSGVVVNGTGTINVTFTPNADRPFTDALENAKITAIINDWSGTEPKNQTATNVLTLEVKQVNDAPQFVNPMIPALVNVEVGSSTTNIVFGISDVETDERLLVIDKITSSHPNIIPTNNVVFGFGSSGDTRTVLITPVGDQTNDVTIGFVIRDLGATGDAAAKETAFNFVVRVNPLSGTIFAKNERIDGPDSGAASPYPSTNTVSGLIGPIHRVFVTLDGVTHPNPDDFDVLLVSPSGGKVMLMSDAGGTTDINNVRLQFSDNGRALPDEGQIMGGDTYQASNYEGSGELNEILASPAPAGPYLRSLGELKGEATANGDWKLYVFDDTAQHEGEIAFGWSMRIVTAPSLTLDSASMLITNEDNTAIIMLDVADGTVAQSNFQAQMDVSFSVGNALLTPITNISYAFDNAGNLTVNVRPGTNEWGTNTVTVTVARKVDGVGTSRQLTVGFVAVPDDPSISRLADAITSEDDPIWIPVQITDPDTPLSGLFIYGVSGNTNEVSHTNITFVLSDRDAAGQNRILGLSTNRYFIRIQPNTDETTNNLPITINVGYTSATNVVLGTATFELDIVEDNDPPTISLSRTSTNVVAGATASVNVTLADPENDTLTLTATSDNSKVVRNEDITLGGSGNNRTVTFLTQAGQIGQEARITISVTDSQPGHSPVSAVLTVTLEESRERVFANTNVITIQDATVSGGRANPFPSDITVSGLVGAITKVVVTLDGFNHTFPDDVDVLLVGPQGQKVVLMSDAGGNTRVTNNAILRFEQGFPVITDSTLVAGTYSPTNYEGSGDNFYEAPAGVIAPDSQGLAAFSDTNPSGVWRLYIVDDTPSDSGSIARGWSLAITTKPEIVTLPDLTIAEDTIGTNTLVIEEEAFIDASKLTFRFASANTNLVTTNNIKIEGTGLTRKVILTPNQDQTGASEITVWAKSGAQEVSDKFILTVTNVNDAPTIETTITERLNVAAGGSVRAPFVISDTETDRKNLVVTIASSNEALVPTNYIRLLDTNIVVFSDANAVADFPVASDVTITVSDGVSATEKRFRVVVDPSRNFIRANNTRINIPVSGPADQYPSTLNISNVLGTIIKMTVTLKDISHTFPDDLDIMLVGPNGTNIVLMSDAGSGGNTNAALVNAWLSFADGGTALPDQAPIVDKYGTNAPKNFEGSSGEFPGATGVDLTKRHASETFAASFNGISPNGSWRLYVYDDQAPDSGSIEGWQISFETTAPTIDFISDLVMPEDSVRDVVFTIADDQALDTISISYNTNELNFVEVTGLTGTGSTRTLSLRGKLDAFGTDVVTITVKDSSGNTVSRSFDVTVSPVNDLPVISGLAAAATPANVTLRIPFTVTDVETASSALVVSASNSNDDVATVALSGADGSYELTVVPKGMHHTNTTVTVTAGDGTATTTNQIVVTITAPLGPVIAEIADVLGTEDQNVQVPFSFSSPGTATATVTHDNANLVFSATVSGTGTNRSVVILLAPNAFGEANFTVTVTDEFGTDTETFKLTVPNTPDAPSLGAITDRTTAEDSSLEIPLSVSDPDTDLTNLVFTATSSNTNLVAGVSFRVENGVAIATVNLVPNASGVAAISIRVSDGANSATSAFALTVTADNDAPSLGAINDMTVNEDDPISIVLDVADSDSALTALTFSGTGSDSNLIRTITFNVSSSNAVANIQLVTNAFGTNLVTISVSEGTNKVSRSFGLRVLEVIEPPVLGPISDIVTNENTVITVPLSVVDADNSLQDLSFFSQVQGTALVSDIQFVFGEGGTVAAVITLKQNAAGTETVTISVSDGNDVVRQSFNLTVNAVNDPPTISPIADQTVTGGTTAQVTFTVTDPDNQIGELAFSGSTGGNGIVTGVAFEVAGPNTVRATLTLAAGKSGTERVTFSASDGENTGVTSFNLTVNAQIDPASLRIAKGAGSSLTITATGTPNATYVIEGTANFNTWTQAGTITIGASGTGTLTIQNTGSYQFFRARNQ